MGSAGGGWKRIKTIFWKRQSEEKNETKFVSIVVLDVPHPSIAIKTRAAYLWCKQLVC